MCGTDRLNLFSARGVPPSSTGSASAMLMTAVGSTQPWPDRLRLAQVLWWSFLSFGVLSFLMRGRQRDRIRPVRVTGKSWRSAEEVDRKIRAAQHAVAPPA